MSTQAKPSVAFGLLELSRADDWGTHFCAPAGNAEVPEKRDYFAMFELPRKLWIEMGGLEKKFLQLSWKLHPDNFVKASPRSERFR